MYEVVQFGASQGNSISVVAKKWLTPMKTQSLWPPQAKDSKHLEKYLRRCESPDSTWSSYDIQRIFYATDDLEKAKKKLLLLETSSDIQSDVEAEEELKDKRKRQKSKRPYSSSDDNDDDRGLDRPPALKKKIKKGNNKNDDIENKVPEDGDEQDDDSSKNDEITIVENQHITPVKLPAAIIGEANKKKLPSLLQALGLGAQNKGPSRKENPKHSVPRPGGSGVGKKPPSIEPKVPESPNNQIVLSDKVVTLLSELKVQNSKIIALLTNSPHTYYEPLNEEFKFPLETEQQMRETETLLAEDSKRKQLVSYLKSLGGREVKDKVTRLMRFLLTDNVAKQYNYYGKRSYKKPFSESRLRHCVIEAVKITTPKVTEREVEDSIKNWLKHAPEREKKRLSRNLSQGEPQE